ncbi:hypothetical protein RRG08_061812 [Elysia crispata]|uniref:Uncharacterized protein n=1 Tax=Elysia crispata TaxID=231223 RepID=A0AAE0YID9_9GAST|nr:hypothetical protein RRG08_061812 [Elysia crispata]
MAQTNDPDTGKDQIVDVHGQPTSLHTKHQNIHGTLDIYEALDQDFLDCEWLGTLKRDPVEKFCCCECRRPDPLIPPWNWANVSQS